MLYSMLYIKDEYIKIQELYKYNTILNYIIFLHKRYSVIGSKLNFNMHIKIRKHTVLTHASFYNVHIIGKL